MSNRVSVLDKSFRIPTVHHTVSAPGQSDGRQRADGTTNAGETSGAAQQAEPTGHSPQEPLLREALGSALKNCRVRAGFTLRELSDAAAVSPGYLSELERGRKEVSSEVLAAICSALQLRVSDLVLEAVSMMAMPPVPC